MGSMSKAELDREYNQIKYEVMAIIEASVVEPQQRAAKELARARLEESRVRMLCALGIEKKGEFDGHGQRREQHRVPGDDGRVRT